MMLCILAVLALSIKSTDAFNAPRFGNTFGRVKADLSSKASSTALNMGLADSLINALLGMGQQTFDAPCVMGDESIMSPKEHGTSAVPVQQNLRWDCDRNVADKICNFNRHSAEYRGYWVTTSFPKEASSAQDGEEITFYDSNTGKALFVAPKGRSMESFLKESQSHGWPSFRDDEVVWENVRCLPDGETVSVDGTHLGHNLPDFNGSRYCINLVSVAGQPVDQE
mmetsp:Transcript_48893/g.72647  ORF Transcript_48893/g.72647 Transcript_48893/m.72647 type:complete len:225 (-) Transcript_48893:266-940(-)|eukprot:CAMPEP_0195522458 /NCGR_PEP_ID=MMETSP0794_2-20130614/20661_1 /TAXON_ID=515487 /ORGANISM="Stephanopyxis turris, Strain CCMP 815" /LENGTH=224 /DNA_ID=CAMNT_0040652221 /DNA_START=34 /DNA_END=708 /DNA_ORIENTATION=-